MNTRLVAAAAAAFVSFAPAVAADQHSHNPAIKDPHVMATRAPAHGSNSFTESQARGRIIKAGYTNVGRLTKDQDGAWQGTARRGHRTVHIGLDYKGNVTAH